ncbi:MAG: hypothetical protein ABSA59_11835 [Terriglobia bacterium]|jgi:hypothetical protein
MARIFAKQAWLVAVLTALPFHCSAQEKPFVIPLVPAADWRQVDSHPLLLAAVSKYGGDPAVEQEYGVKALELRTYQLGKTRTQVVVEPTPDAIAAYGLLRFYQTPAMTPEKDIQLAVGDANQTLMARGNNFIRFLHGNDSPPSASDYQALLVFVGGSKPSRSAIRSLPSSMPPKGLVPGSEKYLLGLEAAKRVLPSFRTDLIGFEQGAQVQLGQYQTGKGTPTLVSISYPTPQIARVRFGALTDLLGLNRDHGEDSVYGRRHRSYVFLVLNAGNAGTAFALMDQFQVTESVSWDKPYITERSFTLQVVHMILAILLLTAFLIGACVVAGVLFFLSRRLAAKFFPDSQWGRTDEDQLIRLNLKT